MRSAMTALAAACVAAAAFACAPGEEDSQSDVRSDVRDARDDGDVPVEAEAEAAACTTVAQCDDGIACTTDLCRADGTCSHTADNSLCGAGELCSLTEGCTTGCITSADCSNGVFCDGEEECLAGDCFAGTVPDCADGDVCTEDRCDAAEDHCVHERIVMEGCDSDAGDAGVPFDPLVHYSGTFLFAPSQSQACPAMTYSVENLTFARTDTELTVSGPPCAMVQAPPPSGADFAVLCTNGCGGSFSLTGTFSDSNNFAGHWTATFPSCPSCSGQSADVVGVRL
jgi:hypothetical protein